MPSVEWREKKGLENFSPRASSLAAILCLFVCLLFFSHVHNLGSSEEWKHSSCCVNLWVWWKKTFSIYILNECVAHCHCHFITHGLNGLHSQTHINVMLSHRQPQLIQSQLIPHTKHTLISTEVISFPTKWLVTFHSPGCVVIKVLYSFHL